jgi:formiminotetrahydrofolate cyclodeaminase
MRDALDVPFMICRLCFEAAKLCPPLIKKGNLNLISDVAVAVILLESGFSAARFNVEINLKSLQDRKLDRRMQKELGQKEKMIKKIRVKTEAQVGKVIRG